MYSNKEKFEFTGSSNEQVLILHQKYENCSAKILVRQIFSPKNMAQAVVPHSNIANISPYEASISFQIIVG